MDKIVIAIDWFVATGKGVTAKGVAKIMWYTYLDTGAMYRAVTLYAMRNNLINADADEKVAMMQSINLVFQHNSETENDDMFLNGENVEREIRTKKVAMEIYKIASVPWIRKALGEMQYAYWVNGGIVADGRDMGTVVFHDAPLKVFLEGDLEVRVLRRYKQKEALWLSANMDDIRKEVEHRDREDYLGPHAVNKKATDAITIDTTDHTIESQVKLVVDLAQKALKTG